GHPTRPARCTGQAARCDGQGGEDHSPGDAAFLRFARRGAAGGFRRDRLAREPDWIARGDLRGSALGKRVRFGLLRLPAADRDDARARAAPALPNCDCGGSTPVLLNLRAFAPGGGEIRMTETVDLQRPRDWSWWYLLLLIPFVAVLWVPFYNSAEP